MSWIFNPFTGNFDYYQSSSGGSPVTSVSGTTDRITSTGGTTPVIDIAATYVGQSSIITLGTITTGVWNGTVIIGTYGGTGVNNGTKTLTYLKNISLTSADDTGVYTLPTGTKTLVATDVTTLSSLVSVGTIGTGVWQGTVIAPAYGGTGVANNAAMTVTGSGNYAYTRTLTGITNVTFPTSGTLATLTGIEVFTGKTITLTAGTTGVAPLTFATGTSLTSAAAGAMEYTTDDLFFTIATGTARKRLLMADPVGGLTSGRIPTVTTNGRLTDSSGLTWNGTDLVVNSGNSSIDIYLGSSSVASIGSGTGKAFSFYSNNTDVNKFYMLTNGDIGLNTNAATAQLHIAQRVSTTGSPKAFLVVGGAHTTLTASAEAIDVNFNFARTVQFSTGALTTQRAFLIQAPTYGFVGASTITDAVTLEITGAPALGTSATFTRSWAARILGNTAIGGSMHIGSATGVIAPTALLHLGAGTTSASTAPLKFTSGTNMTAVEAGAMEYDGTQLYFSPSSTRNALIQDNGARLTSGRVPFATTSGYLVDDSDMTFSTDTLTVTKLIGSTSITSNGTIRILEGGSTPTKYTIFQGGDQTIDLTYTLPVAYPGSSGYVLSSTTGGVMSWVANGGGGGGGSPSSPDTSIQYNSSGSFAGSSKLLFDELNGIIRFGVENFQAQIVAPDATTADTNGGTLSFFGGMGKGTGAGGALYIGGGYNEDFSIETNVTLSGTNGNAELDVHTALSANRKFTFPDQDGTLYAGDTTTAPSTTATPVFTSYYGGNTKALGDPVAWATVKFGSTTYKIPLFT